MIHFIYNTQTLYIKYIQDFNDILKDEHSVKYDYIYDMNMSITIKK